LKLIDTHCHLQMRAFRKDIEDVVDSAVSAGVKKIINIGFDLKSSEEAVEFTEKYPLMYAAVGIHPHDAVKYDDIILSKLDNFLKKDGVVAVGEIGLDFKRNYSPREVQIRVFSEQLNFAKERNIPVVLHIRDAYDEVFRILEQVNYPNVLLHCFCGNNNDAKKALGMGCYVAFGGNITYSDRYSPVIESIPLERIVLETDAPYLSPAPMRGKRNEPAFIAYTAKKLAWIKNMSLEDIGEITTGNAEKFFNLKKE